MKRVIWLNVYLKRLSSSSGFSDFVVNAAGEEKRFFFFFCYDDRRVKWRSYVRAGVLTEGVSQKTGRKEFIK